MMAQSLSSKPKHNSAIHSSFLFATLIILCGVVWLILLPLTDFSPLVLCTGLLGLIYVLEISK